MNKKFHVVGGGGEVFPMGVFFLCGQSSLHVGAIFSVWGGSIELPPNNNFCWSLFRLARAPLESGIDYFWKL